MANNIQFVDLKAQYAPLKEEILAGISQVLDGMHLFLGENVQAFEKEFADFCGVKHGIGVSDGTTALHVILRALEIGPGDEVITVPNTFIATAEALAMAGATPVFVDIDPQTYLMDLDQVEAKITPQTKAIMPVHLYGQMLDMEHLREIADRHGLKIIEDACQAHGAEFNGKQAAGLGDAAAYSFYFSKNLGGYGEGGFISTNDDETARRVRMIRDHGSERRYCHDLIGMNGRLDEIQAVVLRVKLKHLADWNDSRRKHADLYKPFAEGHSCHPSGRGRKGETCISSLCNPGSRSAMPFRLISRSRVSLLVFITRSPFTCKKHLHSLATKLVISLSRSRRLMRF